MDYKMAAHRVLWVDFCRGICIIMVVFGHVTGGLGAAKILPPDSVFLAMRAWVYLFHMPAFFLLSGLFAWRGADRSWVGFVKNKTRVLGYPYILWTGVYLAFQTVMARYSNNPPLPGRALKLLWEPYGYGLWFLYSLFLISLLFHLLQASGARRSIVLLVSVIFYLCARLNAFGFWPILNLSMLNFVFYVLGGLAPDLVLSELKRIRPIKSLAAGASFLGIMTVGFITLDCGSLYLQLPAALLGIAGVVFLASGITGLVSGAFISLLGYYSLEIYLGHVLFSTGARAAFGKIGIYSPALDVLFCVLAGLFASVGLAMLCRKINFPYLFRWPLPSAKRTDL